MIRSEEHLRVAMRLYPSTGRMVDDFRQDRGNGLPDWPTWCFMPMAGWYAIVSQDNYEKLLPGDRLPLHLIPDVARLAAIGTWRYSQGVYKIDDDLRAALCETLIVGDIPVEVLYRLPEWCLYIETSDFEWLGIPLFGYWAHLEFDINTGRSELRLLLDTEESLIPIPVHMGPWTVTEAIDRAAAEAVKQSSAAGVRFERDMNHVQSLAGSINPLISLLLYICSEAPEIDDERQPGTSPNRAQPVKTKRGWRLFPAEKPRIWTVGRQIGERLRDIPREENNNTGRTVRPHLRRGHWHGYWMGPREGQRKFIYKWIMPTIVAGGE